MPFPYTANAPAWVEGAAPGISAARLTHLETQFQSVIDLLTIRGDLPYRGAATWERLAKGTSGQILSCDANDPVWIDDPTPTIVRKTADQTVNNSNVLVNDTHLKFTILANEVWLVDLHLLLDAASANADWKYGWSYPVGCTMYWHAEAYRSAANVTEAGWAASAAAQLSAVLRIQTDTLPDGAQDLITGTHLIAIIVNGATPGTINFQWAQNAAQGEDNKVLINSCLIAHQLA